MNCDFVISKMTISKTISAESIEDFKVQLKALIGESKEPEGIAYVWRTQREIPRLMGGSPIIYIGKTKRSLYARYISYIDAETDTYWTRYDHIISEFGEISIDIYKTENPAKTENRFLHQYHQKHLESPPLNIQSYKSSML